MIRLETEFLLGKGGGGCGFAPLDKILLKGPRNKTLRLHYLRTMCVVSRAPSNLAECWPVVLAAA